VLLNMGAHVPSFLASAHTSYKGAVEMLLVMLLYLIKTQKYLLEVEVMQQCLRPCVSIFAQQIIRISLEGLQVLLPLSILLSYFCSA